MNNSELQNKSTDTLLAVISTKLDNLIDKFEKLEEQLDSKVNSSTFQAHLESHQNYLKNLDDRLVEERKHRETIKEEIAFAKGQAKVHGGLWGLASSILVGLVTHFIK